MISLCVFAYEGKSEPSGSDLNNVVNHPHIFGHYSLFTDNRIPLADFFILVSDRFFNTDGKNMP